MITAKEATEIVLRYGMDNLHAAIGVPRDATPTMIKKRTRRLSLLVHPDKCDSPQAAEAFDIVHTAERVLMDAREFRKHQEERKRKRESDQCDRQQKAREDTKKQKSNRREERQKRARSERDGA